MSGILTRIFTASIAGLLFGSGLIISGMVDPNVVLAFLDVFGQWDASLALVMLGALAVFIPCYHLLIKKRTKALNGDDFSFSFNDKVDSRLISGAAIFGIGWGLAGICPGPAITNISSGSYIILVFILTMLVGMKLANKT